MALEKPRTPTEIASALHLSLSHVSRALAELSKKKLVVCLTPNSKMGKLYKRTNYGRNIISYLKKRA